MEIKVEVSGNRESEKNYKHPLVADRVHEGREPSFYDWRFVELYDTALAVAQHGGGTITLWQNTIKVGPAPKPEDMEHLQMLQLNDKWYSFTPCLKDRAAAGKDGLLGSYGINWGRREAHEVAANEAYKAKKAAERAKREAIWAECRSKRNYARQSCATLWGEDLAQAVWEYNAHNKHGEVRIHKVVESTKWALKWLRSCDGANGVLPPTIDGMTKYKGLAQGIKTRIPEVWVQIKSLAEFLYRRCPVPPAPWKDGHAPKPEDVK